jgi:hypothetical protein
LGEDSSAAVIVSQGKWSPRCVIAFEVKEGQIITPARAFGSGIGFLQVDYDKCGPEDFMEIALSGSWKLNAKIRSSSEMRLQQQRQGSSGKIMAKLDLKASGAAEEKWLQKKVTPVFCRNYRDSDSPK